ncbi:cupin domain-containing protein [Sinomicrobium pectinilyticum]|uniref:Cupin domain-containing protein n=1 Tax=Sinomicrobium pectinilyticum TaxID=1084421 RepID=A0A3N0DHS7_SINP1|nr:cupin domain-containing protein [Sinomicrobium pectinilyticum]RNL75229.1 cupin domain-containing protein [Sinomicrobium pectinilyticum]
MIISNIDETLNNVVQDKNVGVKLARLTGDEDMSVFAIELKRDQFIPAHYHKTGIETYFILFGEGIVSIGKINGERIVWEDSKKVVSGDAFTIYPNEVHKFENVSKETLKIIATTPLSHSKEDRFFIYEKE